MPELPVHVRPGTAADLPAVFALVRELAAYERAADAVTVDLATYERDFAAGRFSLLVAERRGGAADSLGMMLFYPAYSTWKGPMLYLEDFVVAEGARGRGVGRALWTALVAEARRREAVLIKWEVLAWNEPARAFYRAAGAELEPGWENGKLFL